MKNQKIVYKTEEQNEMVKFLVVLLIVIGIILGVYTLSKIFMKEEVDLLTYETGSIKTDTAIVGTMLNNSENEYYVLAYDSTSIYASAYLTYAGHYTTQTDAVKIYYLDLNDGMNKNYYVTEKSNPKATKIKDLKMLDGTLIKVNNGKISKYLEGTEAIAKELKVTVK